MLLCFLSCFYSVCTYPSEGSGRQGGNEVVARRLWYSATGMGWLLLVAADNERRGHWERVEITVAKESWYDEYRAGWLFAGRAERGRLSVDFCNDTQAGVVRLIL